MRRGDVVVLSISCALAAIVVAAVTYSVRVLDHKPSSAEFDSSDSSSSWLVLTWGPSLCGAEPTNSGCKSGHVGTQGSTWILHGLWPQPADKQYCGVPKAIADRASDLRGSNMPSVDLGGDMRNTLQSMMSDASTLAPHEWYAHGTCSGVTPDVFFSDAAALTEQARKVLDPMFTEAEGGRIQLSDVRDKFDANRRRSRRTRPPQLSQRDRPRQRRLRAAPVASAGHRAEDPRRHAVAEGPDPQRSAARPRMPAIRACPDGRAIDER